jgi:hypothetical protein
MKKKYNKLAVVVTILTLILAFGLTGCKSEKTAKASSDGDNHNSNDNTSSVTVIKAATTGQDQNHLFIQMRITMLQDMRLRYLKKYLKNFHNINLK